MDHISSKTLNTKSTTTFRFDAHKTNPIVRRNNYLHFQRPYFVRNLLLKLTAAANHR